MSSEESEVDSAIATKARGRLRELLRESASGSDVYDLAGATGLHITTVRFHLGVLLRAGVITARTLTRSTPGRPRSVYELRPEKPSFEPYEPLVALLAANLGSTTDTRRRRAEKAGRDWAADLVPVAESSALDGCAVESSAVDGCAVESSAVTSSVDKSSDSESSIRATEGIVSLFAQMRFDPELMDLVPETGQQDIWLRGCPFRAAALVHPEVICAIHLGLLQGAMTRLGGQSRTASLLPLVEPALCVVRFTSDQPANGAPSI